MKHQLKWITLPVIAFSAACQRTAVKTNDDITIVDANGKEVEMPTKWVLLRNRGISII